MEWLKIFVMGMVGGFANLLLVGFRKPGWQTIQIEGATERIFSLGWIGNIILGGLAACFVWMTELWNPNPPQSYAAAFVSGFIGAYIINGIFDGRTRRKIISILTRGLADDIEKK